MKLNKGEWSELYTILYLILNPNLKIVNQNLEILDENIFEIKKIITNNDIIFNIFDKNIEILDKNEIKVLEKYEVEKYSANLLDKIKTTKENTFEVENIKNFKGKSTSKGDIILLNYDNIKKLEKKLSYSIKSKLGKSSTILNASRHTNFIYTVENLPFDKIEEINNINTRSKLLDRIKKIKEFGGKIKFKKVESKQFHQNLQMVDSLLPELLGEILLRSYSENQKDLKKLFLKPTFLGQKIAEKKIGDFLLAISFGMFPSIEWDGYYTVTGGILIVMKNGDVYNLDLNYYKKEVVDYLMKETKLDTPSSKRYDMLNLIKENGEIIFTLNLQIRYK